VGRDLDRVHGARLGPGRADPGCDVLGRGDETAAEFERAGFATLVEPGSVEAAAAAIVAALEAGTRDGAAAAGERLAAELRWDRAAGPLLAGLEGFEAGTSRSPGSGRLRGAGAYYARRAVDRLLPSA